MADYDIAIIGGGPGGYNAAVEAARLGLKVALIEDKKVGGTCLHLGCIPTKALYESLKKGLSFTESIENAKSTVGLLFEQLKKLLTNPRIAIFNGKGKLESKNEVIIESIQDNKKEKITAGSIIIASGSNPVLPEDYKGNKKIITSDDILNLNKAPKKAIIIGGGYIGCEYATILNGHGAKVKIAEAMPRILLGEDDDVVSEVMQSFNAKGIEVACNSKFSLADAGSADVVLCAVGRKPNSKGMGLEKLGIKMNEKGAIIVNESMQTSIKTVYAIGDVVGMPYRLAHVAEAEGIVAARNIAGQDEKMSYRAIPSTIFMEPLLTSVGKKEHEMEKGSYVIGKAKYEFNPMSFCKGLTQGFVKIIADKQTGRILGASAIGDEVDIHEVAIAMESDAKVEVLAKAIRFHPSKNEAIKRAAEIALRKISE